MKQCHEIDVLVSQYQVNVEYHRRNLDGMMEGTKIAAVLVPIDCALEDSTSICSCGQLWVPGVEVMIRCSW